MEHPHAAIPDDHPLKIYTKRKNHNNTLLSRESKERFERNSHRPFSRILRFQTFRAPHLRSHCPPHFSTTRPFPWRFSLGCRRHGLQPRGHLAPPPSRAHLWSRSSTLRRLLTPAGSKPLWFVSLTSVSRDLSGSSPISCVVPCPRCVLMAPSLHPGSTLASPKAEFFIPFFQSANRLPAPC